MENIYEINRGTLAILPISSNQTKVLELDNKTYVTKTTPLRIVDSSCKSFGSSYFGRHEGTRELTGIKYKTPIIVSEKNEIIFFPTTSPRLEECSWISLNNLKKYEKGPNSNAILYFKDNTKIELNMSYFIVENQIYKATMLQSKLHQAQEN